ncbi:MAG TPA: hypothetical protein P5102_14625 [Candidatus Competibacteraceae bacterium]|nr:hypothetical protein [Candidatus Competibacteraceae bacterium]
MVSLLLDGSCVGLFTVGPLASARRAWTVGGPWWVMTLAMAFGRSFAVVGSPAGPGACGCSLIARVKGDGGGSFCGGVD